MFTALELYWNEGGEFQRWYEGLIGTKLVEHPFAWYQHYGEGSSFFNARRLYTI